MMRFATPDSDQAVTVYAKPGCPPCEATKKTLDRRGTSYTLINLPEDPPALDKVKALGYFVAPVIVVERDGAVIDHWDGFRPERIAALPGAGAPVAQGPSTTVPGLVAEPAKGGPELSL